MVFIDYQFGCFKQEIRALLRKRLFLKDKLRYHKLKIKDFEEVELPKIEKELDKYLKKAGN